MEEFLSEGGASVGVVSLGLGGGEGEEDDEGREGTYWEVDVEAVRVVSGFRLSDNVVCVRVTSADRHP